MAEHIMQVKHFKKASQDFTIDEYRSSLNPVVNMGNSKTLGAGIGKFAAGCNMDWTVTYDEVLFIHEGEFELTVDNQVFRAAPGDILWIPANTALTYRANEDVTFFYAVYPVNQSPSTQTEQKYPEAKALPSIQ